MNQTTLIALLVHVVQVYNKWTLHTVNYISYKQETLALRINCLI